MEKIIGPEPAYHKKNSDLFSSLYEHEKILADKPRVDAYNAAISMYVKPGDRVLDLGTGTGILAFLAARRQAAKVYAIDHSDFIKNAELTASHNGLKNIKFIQKHSAEFTLDAPVDVVIQEQMGDFLLDEYMITNVIDCRERLLKKGSVILASRYELFVEPVKVRDNVFIPFLWQQKVYGIDFSCLREIDPHHERYYRIPSKDPTVVDFFLCEPQSIYSFDLYTLNETDVPHQVEYSRVIKKGGRLDGFIVYFKCVFDDEISFTTGPIEGRATSWAFWLLRVESAYYETGQKLNFSLAADNWSEVNSWRWHHS